MTLITDTASLAAICDRMASAEFITVDTEFMREKTYWPQLCLVQLGGADEAVAVDPLAPGLDLSPLYRLFADERVLKVFHAARQDLEIFYHQGGGLPKPVFDTQIAAMVCGFGESVGYETLVVKLTNASVDKSARFTDWSLRPLSDRQLKYALADVIHLRVIFEKLRRRLESNGRESWLEEEMATLTASKTYALDPAQAFRRIKLRGRVKPRFLAVLRELASWREEEAQQRDLPRNRLLRDEALLEIAYHTPTTVADLARTRGLGQRMAEGKQGQELLGAVTRGLGMPEDQCPTVEPVIELPRNVGEGTDLLKVLLRLKCNETGVAQKLVASSSDVEVLAAFAEKADVPALHGWRRQLFGEDALRLLRGELALAIDGKRLTVVPRVSS